MNLQESEIEQQLRALRPRAPRRELEEGIGAALSTRAITVAGRLPAAAVLRRGKAVSGSWWASIGWAIAGATTAAMVLAGVEFFSTPAAPVASVTSMPAAEAALEHVDSSAEIVSAEDEGLVFSDGAEPVHRVRFISYEHHTWTNPATGDLMEYTVPREDIRLTPIALQ